MNLTGFATTRKLLKVEKSINLFKQSSCMVKPIPDGHHSVTPTLTVKGASDAIEFYKKAFDAQEIITYEFWRTL